MSSRGTSAKGPPVSGSCEPEVDANGSVTLGWPSVSRKKTKAKITEMYRNSRVFFGKFSMVDKILEFSRYFGKNVQVSYKGRGAFKSEETMLYNHYRYAHGHEHVEHLMKEESRSEDTEGE